MKVFIEACNKYDLPAVQQIVERVAELSGLPARLADHQDILLKPNLLGPYPPRKAVTTHPVVVEAFGLYLKSIGKTVFIGDSPGGTHSAESVYRNTGMADIAERHGFSLVPFLKDNPYRVETGGVELYLSGVLKRFDAVINLAKYKTHSLMQYTGAVKNLYGFIPGLKKAEYHRSHARPWEFSRVLAALYSAIREKLVFHCVDGITGMEGAGPSGGDPRDFGVLFFSDNAVALDWIAVGMMGLDPREIGYLTDLAHREGLLPSRIEVPEKWKGVVFPGVKNKEAVYRSRFLSSMPQIVKKVFSRLFEFYPAFNERCVRCGLCVKSCPVSCLRLDDKDRVPVLDRSRCIKCLCCHELCPHNAVYLERRLLAKYIVK